MEQYVLAKSGESCTSRNLACALTGTLPSVSPLLCAFLQRSECLRLDDPGYVLRLPDFIDLDAELLDLLLQALLTGIHLARHPLEDAGELSEGITPSGHFVQGFWRVNPRLDGCGGRSDAGELLHIVEVLGHVPNTTTQPLDEDP